MSVPSCLVISAPCCAEGVSDTLDLSPAGNSVFGGGAAASEGALAFASPEQIRNPGGVDARADIWALGAIFYELLTGVRMFEAETPLTLLAMIAADQPAPIHWLRPEIPDALEAIVFSCLEKDPERRPRSVVDLANAIAPFGSGSAPAVASRVARMAMRASKPPPLPSSAPLPRSFVPPSRAIVRSTPVTVQASHTPLPAWAMMVGAGLVGVCVALAGALALRPEPPATAAAPLWMPPAEAPPAPAAAVPTPTPAAPTTAETSAQHGEKPNIAPPAPAPRAIINQRPTRKAETSRQEHAASSEPAGPTTRLSAASKPTEPSALFGSIE